MSGRPHSSNTIRVTVAALALTLQGCAPRPDLPPLEGQLLPPCPDTPNCVSTEATDPGHAMPPLPFSGSPEQALDNARTALLEEPRSRLVEERPGYLHIEMRSLIFRFVDDVEIAIVPEDSVLHFRSASRVGRGDMGVNRARMERFSTRFRELSRR